MPALGDDRGGLDREAGLRVGTGFGLVLAGAVMLALGVYDFVPDLASRLGATERAAVRIGVVLAGGFVIAVLAAVGSRSSAAAGRRPLDAGLAISSLALLAGGTTASPGAGSMPALPAAVWATYGLGVALAFAGALARTLAPSLSPEAGRSPVSYRREERRVTPADGGEEDDDLDFLLEE